MDRIGGAGLEKVSPSLNVGCLKHPDRHLRESGALAADEFSGLIKNEQPLQYKHPDTPDTTSEAAAVESLDDASSVMTDATDFTTDTTLSTDTETTDKVYIIYPAVNTGESIDNMNPTAAKKRGRKRKTFIHRNFHNPDYIALWEEICNGERVLIDCIGNVYTYDMENPKYLGKYKLDGKIDTTQPYKSPSSNFEHTYSYGGT